MSSLRLALKQSLQESGGGSFGVGENGEGSSKKKRKKHKNKEKKSSKEKKQNSIRKKERVRPRGRRPGEPGIKRKRGRPRKYPPADDDDDNDKDKDTGEKQDENNSSAVKQKRSPKGDDDDDNDNDDDFDSENEFSYTEDDSDDDNESDDSDDDDDNNDDESQDDDDDDDDSQAEDDDDDDDDDESKEGHYRHHKKGRSRTREEDNDVDGDDDDDTMDESTTMHSDDDGDDDDDDDDDEHEQEMEKRRNLHVNSAGAPASSEMAVLKSHLKNYLLGEPQQQRLFDVNGNVKQEEDSENQQEHSQYHNTSSENNNNALKGSSNQPQQSKSEDNEDHNNNNHTRDIRKKQRKLIKLKKKNSAANKIQNMFKSIKKTANENQNDKTSSSSSEQQQQQQQQRHNDNSNVAFDSTGRGGTVGGQQQEDEHNNAATNTSTSIANNTSSNYSNETFDNKRKEDDDGVHNAYSSSSNNFNHLAVSTPVASYTSTPISTNDLSQGNNESVGTGGGGGGGGVSGVIISNNNPDTATDRDNSTTIAGHGGNIVDADVGDDGNDVPVAAVTIKKKNKNKKKKKKNNGQVPAPTSDVLEWVRNLSINKCRKNIAMGMRVKVRFATKVKREGKLIKRKIWYGGRVTAVSEKRQKIRIKYDDGTSEVSKFPDKDVVIDAAMNGEHAVPDDKFCPPPEMTMMTEHDDGGEEGQLAEDDDERKPEARPGSKNTAEPTNNSDDVVKHNHEAAQSLSSTTRTDIPSHDDNDEKVLGGFALVSSSSLTIEKPPITPPPTASDPAPSPEEGELSPGITVCKSTEMSEELAQAQVGDESTQFPSGTSTTLSTTNTNIASSSSMTSTVAAMASVSEEQHQSKDGDNNMEVDELKKHHHPITSTSTGDSSSSISPKPTKKLSIRIPSSSLASIEGFHSPRKSPSVAKTMHNVTIEGSSSSNVDDILTDTPKQVVKRKRTSENSEGEGGEQHPPKRRIKVSIGKTNSYDENTTQDEMSTSRETTMTMMNSDETAMRDLSSKPEPLQRTEGEIEEMELAPGVEAPVEKKKKKKKGHGGKSPRPVPMRSSSPKLVISKEMMDAANLSENPPSSALSTKQQKVGSKGSAFSTAASNDVDGTGPKQTTLESSGSLDSNNSTSRVFGRKAAQEANEKLTVKEKQKAEKNAAGPSIESGKKKKKRRRKDGPDAVDGVGGGEESDEGPNETEWPWVQCDSCGKWRVLPDDVKVSSLPNLWYCHMNMYDPKRRSCDAPEQTAKQALKDRKRARKRAKRMEQRIEAESQQEQQQQQHQQQEPPLLPPPTSTKKSKKIQVGAAGNNTPTISPRPQKATKSIGKLKELKVKDLKSKDQKTKEIKSKEHKTKELKPKDHKTKEPKSNKEQKEAAGEAKKSEIKKNDAKKKANVNPISSALVEQQPLPHPSDSGSDTQKEGKKKGKKGKTQAIQAAENPDTATEATATTAESKKPGRKRGRPARGGNQTSSESKNDSKDEDNVEWVQCDKCEKWRKLPPDISADELPDIWNCSMNTWKPASASCDADEDKADSQHHEVGTSEWQLRQSHAGKYSYRQMIFGSGARKHNRPMSERSRAAESLFTQPGTDEENPHPTTQYSKSSAFLPRMSNFQKANAVEEKAALGIFDVLQYSHLWEELRRMEQNPEKVLSSSSLNISGQSTNNQKLKTYDSLSNDIKHAMQDVVLQTLDLSAMTGEEVIGKAQWYHSSTSMKSVPSIQGYCNTDIIINTLLDLVRDGIVEMATIRDPLTPMSQWVPKYRRVRTKRAIEAVEAIKASRCMKISKPWKQRSESKTTEWITGSKH